MKQSGHLAQQELSRNSGKSKKLAQDVAVAKSLLLSSSKKRLAESWKTIDKELNMETYLELLKEMIYSTNINTKILKICMTSPRATVKKIS